MYFACQRTSYKRVWWCDWWHTMQNRTHTILFSDRKQYCGPQTECKSVSSLSSLRLVCLSMSFRERVHAYTLRWCISSEPIGPSVHNVALIVNTHTSYNIAYHRETFFAKTFIEWTKLFGISSIFRQRNPGTSIQFVKQIILPWNRNLCLSISISLYVSMNITCIDGYFNTLLRNSSRIFVILWSCFW